MSKGKTIFDQKYRALIDELAVERKRLSISQQELAETIGVKQPDISKIEKFERRLDVLEFALILKALRVKDNTKLQRIAKSFLGIPE
ncbi:MAG: XRE family transcriptional regulator [Leptolyngbya foveolarum]|uniref:XRE family transcriptional regulator n=1 Tax=Leptolyngbya foveolarum TaxID=47253 RepID=A0A2W4UGQ7_9CYAN|nr:MAG: XRE family transcriptional regulator [Leptolyngbya foveolarum]